YISIIIGKDKMLYFDDSKYKIHKVGYTYDKQLDTNKLWSFVSKSNRKMLVEQILYLYDNKVEGLKVINAVYIYRYRSHIYMADRQKNLQRYLILTNNPKEIDTHRFKIIDNYKNLYLLANKGARIWTK
ncbi:MAG: hypothetical protein PF588_01570, partial [Candidatus Kapabacteria bacterium]|nr:hypothetical protein [Candidatus Kapabacteria bacterium]